MHFTIKPGQIFLAVAALMTLSACGGAPSDSDIQSAFDKQKKMQAEAWEKMDKQFADAMKSATPEIKSTKKIGCKEDGEKAYKCDVEVEVVTKGNTTKKIVPVRFVKGSDGWTPSK
jgi:hypothetical protein